MNNWHPTNPVERRFMAVHDDWLSFAKDKQAQLLYWHTSEADQRMLAAYIQRQDKLSSAVLRPQSSFEDANQYAGAVADEIVAWYESGKEGSMANGITADWTPPSRDRNEAATPYLLRLTGSLMRHHPEVFPQLVLVLEPEPIRKPADFERWLDELLGGLERNAWQTERLRLVLTGTDANPLPWLTKQRPHQAKVLHGRYHMEALPRELVAESDERGPDADFRRLFVALNDTITNGTPAQLETLRSQALAITKAQTWPDQSVVVHLLAGAAYLKWNSPELALSAYQEATQAGRQAAQAGHAAGNKLTINGLFGEASVYWMQADYRRAAERYTQAAELAQAEGDGFLSVEGWRMCSECFAQMNRDEPSIDAGLRALDAGGLIPVPLRANSNLQMVAQSLLKRVGRFHERRSELTSRLAVLYGEDWPETIQPLPAEEVTQQFAEQMAPETGGHA
ncbi:hypothetical protein [Caballeronia sp. INML2]|jgi:tetratricopeptide (TPR) repeat protein|uniref:hypothetical protein n=1 Tax=Caballeronia sp. INML2 TaxID=2921748 RepID=UPI002027C6A3|nr:hypothetical protein [Caballeronia sp. INML2]